MEIFQRPSPVHKGDNGYLLGNPSPVNEQTPHGINPGVLLVELIMSADRIIVASEAAQAPTDLDTWPAQVILGHLTQVDEEVWSERIRAILDANYNERHPGGANFPWWEPDPVATRERYMDQERSSVAADFLAMRTALLMLLKGLDAAIWQRTWHHEVRGELTLTDLVLWILEHDEEHRGSLLRLVAP